IGRGDMAGALAGMTLDVELEILGPSSVPFLGRWQGRAQVGAAIRDNFAQLEAQHPHVQLVIAQGDTVVVVGQEQGRYKATGKDYDLPWVQLITFQGDNISRIREFVGNESA